MAQTVSGPEETLDDIVVSCIVPASGATVDEAAVRPFARQRLASYKTHQRALVFTKAGCS